MVAYPGPRLLTLPPSRCGLFVQESHAFSRAENAAAVAAGAPLRIPRREFSSHFRGFWDPAPGNRIPAELENRPFSAGTGPGKSPQTIAQLFRTIAQLFQANAQLFQSNAQLFYDFTRIL